MNVLTIFAYVILCYGQGTISSTNCSVHSDCVTEGSERCSICVDDHDGQSGVCIYMYPTIYEQSSACTRFNDSSCPLKCNGRGKCSTSGDDELYYPPYCVCNDPYYGENCQHATDNVQLVGYVRRPFTDPFVPAGEDYFLRFDIFSKDAYLLDMYIKIDDSPFYTLQWADSKTNTKLFQHLHSVKLKSIFPYKFDGNLYKRGNTYVGYKTFATVNLFSNNVIVFNSSWEIFVSYEGGNYKCLPKITISNCAKDIIDSITFVRGYSTYIEIDVENVISGRIMTKLAKDQTCREFQKMNWKVWKLNGDKKSRLPQYESYKFRSSITFDPYKLDFGTYAVEVEVSSVRQPKSLRNINSCYFNIVCMPIVAKITGGNERKVSKDTGILLIADQSYDPNMPADVQDHVNIEWTCVNVNRKTESEKFCQPSMSLHVSQQYYVHPHLLVPGDVYNFTLTVWTDIYNNGSLCDGINGSFSN